VQNRELTKGFLAGAAIAAHRIVKFGADDSHVVVGAAATDSLIGVSDLGATSAEDEVAVIMGGVAVVEYGGSVTRGGLLTSDATGKAVAAAPASGSNNRIIGIAMVSGVSGDLGSVLIMPGSVQG
jgi:hypothetical protein